MRVLAFEVVGREGGSLVCSVQRRATRRVIQIRLAKANLTGEGEEGKSLGYLGCWVISSSPRTSGFLRV
jgi:hypothetical protein